MVDPSPLPPQKVLDALGRLGFVKVRQRGNHVLMQWLRSRSTVIPVYEGEEIGRGLLRKIIQDTWTHSDEFLKRARSGKIRPVLRDSKNITPRTRKDVYRITLRDLERCPVWQFAHDEEGRKSQTEETLRPAIGASSVNATEGIYIVRAEFSARDGTRFFGFCTPSERDDLAHIQPVIVTAKGHVDICYGRHPPSEEELQDSYKLLGKSPQDLFPLKFRALLLVLSGTAEGTATGFSYLTEEGDARAIT